MKLKHVICSLALLIGSLSSGYSQQQYQPSPENLKIGNGLNNLDSGSLSIGVSIVCWGMVSGS